MRSVIALKVVSMRLRDSAIMQQGGGHGGALFLIGRDEDGGAARAACAAAGAGIDLLAVVFGEPGCEGASN